MIRLIALLSLLELALIVVALIDCIGTEEYAVRNLPKIVWVLLILLFSPIGAIAWFAAGRPQRHAPAPGGRWRPGAGFPESERPRRPLGPDDDPDFLGRTTSRQQDEDRELLRKWEADLRRREQELRGRDDDTPAG